MSSKTAWARQQDLVSNEKKGGVEGGWGVAKKEERGRQGRDKGSVHWKIEAELLLDSPAQQRL